MNSNSTPISVTSDEVDSFRRSLSQLQTPSALERVVNWMGINEKECLSNRNVANNSDTFCRRDYKVDNTAYRIENVVDNRMETVDENLTSVFNKSVPLCESPNLSKSSSKLERVESLKSLHRLSRDRMPKRNLFAPSSVDSKKKRELCSYLKLMNRDVKKEIVLSRFRRSTRVQNLEKKKKDLTNHKCQDADMNSEKSVKSKISNAVETFTLQSFEDLKMVVDTSKYPLLQENIDKTIFNFVMPPDTVLKEFNDFKHWIKPFVSDQKHNNGECNPQYEDNSNYSPKGNQHNGKFKVKLSETNRIDRRNRELTRFRKRIKKKNTLSVESSKVNNEMDINHKKTIKNEEMGIKYKKETVNENILEQIESKNTKETSNNITKGTENMYDKNSTIQGRMKNGKFAKKCNKDQNSLPNENKRSKCIILLHDENVVNGFDEEGNKSSENIEIQENVNNSVDECENFKIRIDYDSKHSSSKPKIPSSVNSFRLNEVQMPYFTGFSKTDVEESERILSKLNIYIRCIQFVPEPKKITNHLKIHMKTEKNRPPVNNIKYKCINIDSKIDRAESECSITSGSCSSGQSEKSSTSNSTSISGKIFPTNHSTPNYEKIELSEIPQRVVQVEPFSEKGNEVQSLHHILMKQAKKVPSSVMLNYVQEWDSDNSVNGKQKFNTSRNNSHFISFSKENGAIQNAVYNDFHLILVQEFVVSMWNQTALGNVLGAQNLWIFNGETKKLTLNRECTRKKSLEMTVSLENCVAYVEIWTKEHKSDIRQGPVADVFAIVYFWLQKSNRMDKKVHQLENINGFSDDVQYVVLKSSLNIVVSWHSVIDDVKITQIHLYTLASDFQKIVNVRALSKVEHYISSLHNIEDCEELLMGCGEHTITLWNIEHGYIVASIKLNDIKLSLSTLWTKCDRGILFTVQQCVDKELRLIAINGRSHSWKKLKSYKPPEGFERIQNVYIENGVLISFYEEGILCWKAQSEEQILEETHETDVKYFPSGKYVVMTTEKTVFIRHALTHLLTAE